jgi:hypothetical protein
MLSVMGVEGRGTGAGLHQPKAAREMAFCQLFSQKLYHFLIQGSTA